ncbi:transcription factor WhiB [Mycobacterium sp. GA-1285]|nr:transcription factor WhiB [Mycobacterium sp. GA-1285]
MSFGYGDFDRLVRLDNRVFGSVDSAPHARSEPAPVETPRRPQLSLVPDPIDMAPALTPEDELWQEKALCAQTDPEAFFPEKGGSTREAKRICQGCEVRDACLEYALAHDERFGIWGGLSERERRRLKRGII